VAAVRARRVPGMACEVVYEDGRFTQVDLDRIAKLHDSSQHALKDDEIEQHWSSKALLPHVRRFYAGYFDPKPTCPTAVRALMFES